ncbi:MAG: ABC transporter permease [Planctomycetaceae bacterium]|nr:ABC transporter permease [Planctomycetaceae bacterium]
MAAWSSFTAGGLMLAADTDADPATRIAEAIFQWQVASVVGLLLLGGLLVFLYGTRSGIIARAAAKEAIRQPMFPMLMAVAVLMLVLNTFIPFFSLGDDVKMLEICGVATMLICGMLLAIWTSSMSIADEIEGKTAITLLSKPINRRQFIVGKFMGIQTAVLLLLAPLVLVLGGLIFYKVFYDAHESANDKVTRAIAMAEALSILPATILCYFEIAVMSAISVAISTRMPMVVNMVTCFAIFVVGHLTPSLVGSNLGRLEPVVFMARVIATILPAIENFNVETAIVTGMMVPASYLGWTALYSAAYAAMAILLAFISFEDRDLA